MSSETYLKEIRRNARRLESAKFLSGTKITSATHATLVASLAKNTHLKILDLSNTKSSGSRIAEVIQVTNIIELDICKNNLSKACFEKIEEALKGNFSITALDWEPNNTTLKKSKTEETENFKGNITNLLMQNQDLASCKAKEKDQLSLIERNLKTIPIKIYKMKRLIYLNLSHNALERIPCELYKLKQLEALHLSHNLIRHIEGKGISSLTCLKTLDLSNNLLSQIPFTITSLPLVELNLTNNLIFSLQSIPYVTLQSQGTSILCETEKVSRFQTNRAIIPHTRIFVVGDRESRALETVTLILSHSFGHDACKPLTLEEKRVIFEEFHPINNSPDYKLFEWYPITSTSAERSVSSSGIPKRSARLSRRLSFSSKKKISVEKVDAELSNSSPPSSRRPSKSIIFNSNVVRSVTSNRLASMKSNKEEGGPSTIFFHISFGVFDSISSLVHPLLSEGANLRIPMLLVIQLTPTMIEMLSKLCKILQSLPCNITESGKNIPPLFIVSTYKKEVSDMKKTTAKLRKNISILFPSLVFEIYPICVQNKQGIKKLTAAIVSEVAGNSTSTQVPLPYLGDDCPKNWIFLSYPMLTRLSESIRKRREEIEDITDPWERLGKSVWHWDEFVEFAASFDIVEDNCEKAASYLRHQGIIHHYRDCVWAQNSVDFLVFLLPDILFKSFSMIVRTFKIAQLQLEAQSALTVISTPKLRKIWGIIPDGLHDSLIALLVHVGQLCYLGEERKYFLVPSTFAALPKTISFEKAPTWKEGSDTIPITRCFSFTMMNDINFCKLVSALHCRVLFASFPECTVYLRKVYRYCLEIELITMKENENGVEEEEIVALARVTYDFVRYCVTVFSYEDDSRKTFFCWLADELEQLFTSDPSFCPTNPCIHAICVCARCRSLESDIDPCAWIPMEKIESMVAEGNLYHYCDGTRALRVDLVAPDISLSNLQHMIVDYSSVEVVKKVGDGGFASVYYGIMNGNEIAVKVLDKSDSLVECFPEFRREVSLMAGLQHPNTVGLLGLCKQPFCVLTEFCAYGDLFSYIKSRSERNTPLPMDYIMEVLLDIANGMKFLHEATPPILHRDLKSPNILLCKISPDEADLENPFPAPNFLIDNHVPSKDTAKVADFGLSMKTHGPVTERVVDNPIWLAPELLAKQPYSWASDVYAFGIMVNEMFSLTIPFDELEYKFTFQLEDMIIGGARPVIPDIVPPAIKALIIDCWQHETSARPTFTSIVASLESLQKVFCLTASHLGFDTNK